MITSTKAYSVDRVDPKAARLLIIEDNADHGIIIANAVKHCLPNVTPVFLTTETEAITYLQECGYEEWQLPKLILLDLYLPDRENGWRILQKIRSLPADQSTVPVVLLSSSTHRKDINEAYNRGCTSYLVKPGNYNDWLGYFRTLRSFWWETASLPDVKTSLF